MEKIKSIQGEGFFFEETINFGQIKRLLDNKGGKAGIQVTTQFSQLYLQEEKVILSWLTVLNF